MGHFVEILFNSVQTYCFIAKHSHLLSSNGAVHILLKSFVNRDRDGQNNKTDTFAKHSVRSREIVSRDEEPTF